MKASHAITQVRKSEPAHTVKVKQTLGVLLEHYLYAPGPPGVLEKHAPDDYQIGLSLNFPGAYEYRGATHLVPAASLSVIHPGELHAARDIEVRHLAAEFRMMYLKPSLLQQVASDTAGRTVSPPFFATSILLEPRMGASFLTAHQSLMALMETSGPTLLEQESLLLSLLTRLIRYCGRGNLSAHPFTPARPEVQRAREYLHAHATQNVSLQELARIAGLSPFHFARAFRKEFGLPPHRYQVQLRIDQARRLLALSLPISQVATDTGFYDQSHFGWHFKRLVGVTPAHYVAQSKNLLDAL